MTQFPSRRGSLTPILATVVALAVATGLMAYLMLSPAPTVPVVAVPADPPLDAVEMDTRIQTFCGGSCHAYPPADSFPKKYWQQEVERGFRFYEQSGLSLGAPPVDAVVRHYEALAPEELPHAKIVKATQPMPRRFEQVSYPPPPGPRPGISHVKVVKRTPTGPTELLACDMLAGRILTLTPSDAAPAWKTIATVPNPAHAETVDLNGDGILDIVVANLGSFPPTDRRCGGVVWLRGNADGSYTSFPILTNVGRVADVQFADFRGTGKLDLIVGVFGLHATGEIIFLENQTTDWANPKFVPKEIDKRHGAIHVPVADLNNDGKPDFVAVIAQEHESVVAFLNDGNGNFTPKTLFAAPHPGYGSSGIQLIDMNADGKLDVLYTNGDILDEPYLLKPYHGVQWLENKGNLQFAHHPMTAMYGCHNATAADIFGTGRMSAVAVSFLPGDKFPDRAARQCDGVVVLEQTAPGQFARHALGGTDCDAVVCTTGDLFNTGRQDLIIGNFSSTTTDHPVTIWRNVGK